MSKARSIGPAGMSGLTALRGASSLVRSVRRGTIALAAATTNTAALSPPVDPDQCELVCLGCSGTDASDNPGIGWGALTFTDGATITATRTVGTGTLTISYEVIEYAPGVIKRVQRGNTAALTANPTTITLPSAVNPDKTRLACLGLRHGSFVYRVTYSQPHFVLTNGTDITVTLTDAGSGAGVQVYWQALEFF